MGRVAEKKRKFGDENGGVIDKLTEKEDIAQPREGINLNMDALKNDAGPVFVCNPKGKSPYDSECEETQGRIKRLRRLLDQ